MLMVKSLQMGVPRRPEGEDGEEISQWVGLEVRVCLPSLRTLSYQYGKKRASEEETRPRKRRN